MSFENKTKRGMLLVICLKQEPHRMFDDPKLAMKDEDEMEDFRDYDDEADDLDSKLDDYEEDEDEEDDEEVAGAKVVAPVPAPEAAAPEDQPAGTPAQDPLATVPSATQDNHAA